MSETTNPTSSHEESVSAEASASPEFAPKPPSSRRLYQAGIVGCLGLLAYYTYTAKTASPVHLGCGLAMIVGAMYPSLMWAKRANFRFPVFEVFMLTGLNTYAIPLLSGHEQLASYSDDEITAAAFGVLLYQAVANFVFAVTRARPKSSRARFGRTNRRPTLPPTPWQFTTACKRRRTPPRPRSRSGSSPRRTQISDTLASACWPRRLPLPSRNSASSRPTARCSRTPVWS